MVPDCTPVGAINKRLKDIGSCDYAYESCDHRFETAESTSFQPEDDEGCEACQNTRRQERNVKEEIHPKSSAEKLREVSCHGDDFRESPHRPHHRARKLVATHFGKITSGCDAQLGRECLDQHRHQIAHNYHPY